MTLVWRWEPLFSGYARRGLFTATGRPVIACIAEAYTHYWPFMSFFPTWRVIYYAPLLRVTVTRTTKWSRQQ